MDFIIKRCLSSRNLYTRIFFQLRFNSKNVSSSTKTEDEIRELLLNSSLKFVNEHGWSTKALVEGARSIQLPATAHGIFPRGGIDLIHAFYAQSNRKLSDHLKTQRELIEKGEMKKNLNFFIKDAVEYRLRMIIPYLDNWPIALAKMAMPYNAFRSLSLLTELCDDIWYEAGDKSIDFNWYSKRGLLAAVYKSTELYIIQDKSIGFENTWAFLDRRLKDLGTVGKFFRQSEQVTEQLVNNTYSLFHTGCNVLGLNIKNR